MNDQTALIVFGNGDAMEPIPFGEEESTESYDERIARLEEEIENGGRGQLSSDDSRRELEHFKKNHSREEWNNRTCHDCGVQMGEYHRTGCDWEECPRCGGQYISCDCETEEKKEIWGDE